MIIFKILFCFVISAPFAYLVFLLLKALVKTAKKSNRM